MPSVKVLNQSDAHPWHLKELLPSNGRWRVLVLPGDITIASQASKLINLGNAFNFPSSFLRRFTPPDSRYDHVFEVLAIHRAPRISVTIFYFPFVFREYDESDGWDYSKIYADDVSYHESHGNIYQEFGIAASGCNFISRPDLYVSYLGHSDDTESVDKFFSAFMVSQAL